MGIPGKASKKGVGEKEPDGSVRDSLLKINIPFWKLERLKQEAAKQNKTLTDLVSEIIGKFLETIDNYAEYLAQQKDDGDEG